MLMQASEEEKFSGSEKQMEWCMGMLSKYRMQMYEAVEE